MKPPTISLGKVFSITGPIPYAVQLDRSRTIRQPRSRPSLVRLLATFALRSGVEGQKSIRREDLKGILALHVGLGPVEVEPAGRDAEQEQVGGGQSGGQ